MSSGPSYLLTNSLVQQSPIADKYYLQLADHSLLDLLRQAVKSILIFNLPLQQLPILHLQKEIYLIYDNRIVKEQDVLDAVKHEIRETAKLQKKFLDMSFTYLEKERLALSDMRDPEDDIWSVSWARHRAKDTEDSLKKSYGVVATLFCNNYATFVQAIREISRLLQHLHRECLIPAIDTDQLEEALLEIVTHQFFLQYNCLDLHKVLPIMAQPQKQRFVYCSEFGIDLRKKISKYTYDQSLYGIFLPKRPTQRLPSPAPPSPSSPPSPDHNKLELKQLMKEMFLKEFRNSDILSPLHFDEKGKLKLFGRNDDDDEEDEEEVRREIAKLTAKKEQIKKEQAMKEAKLEQEEAKKDKPEPDPQTQEIKKEVTSEKRRELQKDIIQEVRKEIHSGEPKNQNQSISLKNQQKSDKKIAQPVQSDPATLVQPLPKEKQAIEIPLIKSESKKEEPDKLKHKIEPIPKQEMKEQLKQKSKSSNDISSKEEKPKSVSENALPAKASKQQKMLQAKPKTSSPEHIRQSSKPAAQHPTECLQISKTKIVLSSGTTLEARVTSLTINAQDPDKLNSRWKELQANKGMSQSEILQHLAKDYGLPDISVEGFEEKKGEEEERQEKEETRKKKKKHKKKKNRKEEDLKEELMRVKSQSLDNHSEKQEQAKLEPVKPQPAKASSLQKTLQKSEATKIDNVSQEERAICSNLENLEIDDKARVECKVSEQVLANWRKKFFAMKKSFQK